MPPSRSCVLRPTSRARRGAARRSDPPSAASAGRVAARNLARARSVARLRTVAFVVAMAVTLVACGGDDQPSSVTWRNVQLDVPDGWYLLEDEDTRLSIASHDLTAVDDDGDPVRPDGDVVGMFFTYEPGTIPNDWRRFVAEQVDDGVLESDQAIVLDDEVPATQLIFRYESNGVPSREMVVVIPSRSIVVLAQPMPRQGDMDGPDVFLEHVDTFLEVIQSAVFGSPVTDE